MVALVTGAARGIGRAIATALAGAGWSVALGYRQSRTQAETLAAELTAHYGVRCIAVGGNIADEAAVEAIFAQTEAVLGRVELLVNNAGVAQQKLLTDVTAAEWDDLFGIDVRGVFLCCKRALPAMVRAQSGGILNISSVWGLVGASCEVPYSAAKAAVIGLTKALAKEVGPSGVRVNCIAPGVIDTEMNGQLDTAALQTLRDETPLGIIGQPDDVAALAVFLAGPGGRFVTGQVISPNGGFVI